MEPKKERPNFTGRALENKPVKPNEKLSMHKCTLLFYIGANLF